MPRDTHKENIYIYLLILAVMLLALVQCFKMKYLTSKVLPMIVIFTVIALIIIGLIQENSARRVPKNEPGGEALSSQEPGAHSSETWSGYFKAGAWVLGLFAGVWLLSFIVVVPLFTFFYSRRHGTGWVGSILFAAVFTGIIYLVFVLGLKVDMTKGFISHLLSA